MNNYVDRDYLISQFSNFAIEIKDRFHLKGDEPFIMINRYSLLQNPTNSCIAFVLNTETIEDTQYKSGFYVWDNTLEEKSWVYISMNSSDILSVSVNNSRLTPDANKNVNITVPTDINDLTNNYGFIKADDYGTTDGGGSFKPDGTSIVVSDGVSSVNFLNAINDESTSDSQTFSSLHIDNSYAKNADVLSLNNTTVYTPSGDYNPCTKKYVDDSIASLNGIMELKGRIDTSDLLPDDATKGNVYYIGLEGASSFSMYVKLEDGNWLCIGDTSIDLSGFYTKTEIDNLLKNKVGIISTLPSPTEDYLNIIYFVLSDNKFYKCILTNDTYIWMIVSNSDTNAIIHKGNTVPENTDVLWIDTTDTSRILIKTYNSSTSLWVTLNNIPIEYIVSIEENNGSIIATKSDGDTVTISADSSGGVSDYSDLDSKPNINGCIIEGNKDGSSYGLMDKSVYESEINIGYVKNSDKAISLETFDVEPSPLQYYGTDSGNNIGKHSFPINISEDNTVIQQRIFENITNDFNTTIDSLTDINNKAIIQIWKEINGTKNVETTIRAFNSSNKISYNSSDFVMFTDTNCNISKERVLIPQVDTSTDTYSFDFSDYIEIESIESEVDE